MDREAFDDCLLRYGPDIGAWPLEKRADARRLMATDDVARARLVADAVIAGVVERAVFSAPDEAVILAGVRRRIAAGSAPTSSGLETILAHWLAPTPVTASALAVVVLATGIGYALGTQGAGVPDELLLAIAEGNFAGAGLAAPDEAPLWPGRS
ncbi:hypothetical protein [Aurantimonas sp. HBX-1]|uniref:hypothetical protein n=1 Tax=Aurantimonas sp. HBX-1 TaxID=2906072 RepID=UPI001F372525|nr:hypothetical protein [Aurantimonas sp. HBX-1]UIJ72724.1 hypothetical protein LXB15_03460 [Aurantimonas sp. HBX-1]